MKRSVLPLGAGAVLVAACVAAALGGGAPATPGPDVKAPALTPAQQSALCQMVTAAPMSMNDPCVLLAVKDDLKLTAAQVKDLTDSVQMIVAEDLKRLKPEQVTLLKALASGPVSLASVEARMAKEDPKASCPLVAAVAKGSGIGEALQATDAAVLLRCKGTLNAQVDPAYPSVLIALRLYLKLEPGQVQNFRNVLMQGMVPQGASVLTKAQRESIDASMRIVDTGDALHHAFEPTVTRGDWPRASACPVMQKTAAYAAGSGTGG